MAAHKLGTKNLNESFSWRSGWESSISDDKPAVLLSVLKTKGDSRLRKPTTTDLKGHLRWWQSMSEEVCGEKRLWKT